MYRFSKKLIRHLITRTHLNEAASKICDLTHHVRYSFSERNPNKDQERLKYYLFKHHHIIEKGLALPQPRPLFGQPKILDLIDKSRTYLAQYGHDPIIDSIKKTIVEYLKFHGSIDTRLSEDFEQTLRRFSIEFDNDVVGGLRQVALAEMQHLSAKLFTDFVRCRHSVRDFSPTPVAEQLIVDAIDTAKYSPSVCNRQGWLVHCYSKATEIQEILLYQNGNAGFNDTIDKLLIITGDSKAFTTNESNQLYIDGGLFSMTLILALHASGLGSCALNTSYSYVKECQVKRLANIPNHERLIMMLAVGNLKPSLNVAASPRKATSEFFVSHR